MERENVILKKSFQFTLESIQFVELLEENRKFVVANQLLKSSSSIGANIREAQHAESLNDFIHKLKIAAKEAEETAYWLEVCNAAETYPSSEHLLADLKEIQKLLTKIIHTSKLKVSKN